MAITQNVRVEVYGPGTTSARRSAPMASITLDVPDTGQTDPAALPTITQLLGGGGFAQGRAMALVTVQHRSVFCSVATNPNAAAEPRMRLRALSEGGQPVEIEMSGSDRLAFMVAT